MGEVGREEGTVTSAEAERRGRWMRWRGCGPSDKERLHCRIHFVLVRASFGCFSVQPAERNTGIKPRLNVSLPAAKY